MTLGDGLMVGLLVFYLVLMAVFLYEQQWAKASYWLGAA